MTTARLVGVLGDNLGDAYSVRVVEGMRKRFARHGISLVGFAGGFPSAPFFRAEDGSARLPSALDAVVVLAETIEHGREDLVQAVARSRVPIVSVGVELSRAASVLVNDELGVYQAVTHLVKRHECKRVAFIAGPKRSSEAERRLKAYCSALEDLGLPRDPTLLARGDYEARSGRDAVLGLCRRDQQFDAIVAANDLMAIGALEGLKAARLRVPEDVKVVGFDDTPEASFVLPALTTVRQPIYEQGLAAAELVISMLARETPQDRTISSTALVIRQSCGCSAASDAPPSGGLVREVEQDRRLVEQAFRRMIRQQLAARRKHSEILRLGAAIISASGLQELGQAVTPVLRLIGSRRFLLCVYSGAGRHARVLLESRGRQVVYLEHAEAYPIERLVPSAFLEAQAPAQLLIEPLQVGDEQLGFSVMDIDDLDPHVHLELRHLLSSALSRIFGARELRRLYTLERKYSELTRHAGS